MEAQAVEPLTDRARREQILRRGRLSVAWAGEPRLGSCYGEEEIEAAVRAIRESMDPAVGFGMADGELDEFEHAFARYIGTKHAIAVSSAGGGIEMALRALDLEPGDEVICPTINFRAVPMAVLGQGGRAVYCEVDPVTLQADPEDVERRITPRTRAIFVTHMNGLSAPMDELTEIAARHPHPKHGPAKVIGDAARALGAGYKGEKVGKKGWVNVFSFHTMKNMTTLGEGGACTTDDPEAAARLSSCRTWGGEHYGCNYKMTNVQAAVGRVQLGRLDEMVAARQALGRARTKMLAGCPEIQLPCEPDGYEHCYYLYSILVSAGWAGEKRDRLISILSEDYGVSCVVANPPAHETIPYLRRAAGDQHLPISHEIGQRIFCPPIHPSMSKQDNEYIAAAIWEAVERIRKDV